MPIKWNLREWLCERGVTRASHVSKIVFDRTGYVLSTQAVCDLLNDQPKMLRLETGEALCDAFYCRLSDFLEVKPRVVSRSHVKKNRKLEPGGSGNGSVVESRENSKVDFASFFPDARKFSSESKNGSQL